MCSPGVIVLSLASSGVRLFIARAQPCEACRETLSARGIEPKVRYGRLVHAVALEGAHDLMVIFGVLLLTYEGGLVPIRAILYPTPVPWPLKNRYLFRFSPNIFTVNLSAHACDSPRFQGLNEFARYFFA